MKRLLSALLGLLLIASSASAATYYMDATNGNDAWAGTAPSPTPEGSPTNGPWQTITKLETATIGGGDTILFKRGEHWSGTTLMSANQYWSIKGGSIENIITYSAYGSGNRPILDAGGVGDTVVFFDNKNYILLEHLAITGDDTLGCIFATNTSGNTTISDCEIYGSAAQGVAINAGANWTIDSCIIRDNALTGLKMYGALTGGVVSNSTVYNNGDDGLDASGSAVVTFHHNIIYDNGTDGLGDNDGDGITAHTTAIVTMYNNILTDNWKSGYHGVDTTSVTAYNNLFLWYDRTPSWGGLITPSGTVYNNVFYNANNDGSSAIETTVGVITSKNNIFVGWANALFENVAGTINTDYDAFYGNTSNYNGVTPGAHNITSDPKFRSTTDFRLQPSSPCINKGINVSLTTDFLGHAISGIPDIGAYEFRGSKGGGFNFGNFDLRY